uniref:Arachidonate--CoA ligase n=1 Tax=Astyanax mexicanus TaxID=7994 RepID=A0A8B9RPJ6_ASTMX
MQAQELLKQLRLPELDEVRQYVRSLSTRTLVGVGAFAAVTTYLYATRPKALKPPCDLHMQSLPVPGEEFARMSALMEDGALLSFYYDDATTMYECFTRGMRVSSKCTVNSNNKYIINYFCSSFGTTGNPKGAMLTHRNIVSNVSAFTKITETSCPLSPSDSHISYLPLAHMFERVVQGVLLVHGGSIGFFQGDIRVLMDDLTTLRPTVFPVVPRLLNRMFDKIYGQANTPLKKWVLEFAFRRKEAEMMSGIMRRNSFWDKAIFKKVQASVGGCVRLMMTGAAPVSAPVLTFLRAALGCQFYEGYGQTECTAGCSVTLSGDWSAGHVGPPLPCNYVKLVDVAEMNYLAVNGEGEVCVKGPNVFKGYLKDPEKTEEAIDKEGWVHTGDIGRWLPNGTLKIVDRKKHIFKLAQGEYIAPEKIENIYIRCEAVVQAFVHGDSLQACLVAIIIPDPDFLPAWANKKGFRGSYKELCSNKAVKTAILEDILKLGKESGLKSFEQVKDISLHTEMFSVQNGLLTPTLKAKRADLRNHFRQQIDELYSHIHM